VSAHGNESNLLIIAVSDLVERVQNSLSDVIYVHAPSVGMKIVDAKFY